MYQAISKSASLSASSAAVHLWIWGAGLRFHVEETLAFLKAAGARVSMWRKHRHNAEARLSQYTRGRALCTRQQAPARCLLQHQLLIFLIVHWLYHYLILKFV